MFIRVTRITPEGHRDRWLNVDRVNWVEWDGKITEIGLAGQPTTIRVTEDDAYIIALISRREAQSGGH